MTAERDLAAEAVERATRAIAGADVLAAANRHQMALTRFANSAIHQNVAEDVTRLQLTVHREGRTASGSATVVGPGDVAALVERTVDSVRIAPRDPGWPGVAAPAPAGTTPMVDQATAHASPADRAHLVHAFVEGAGGLETAGYCRTTHWTGSLATSGGQLTSGEAVECGMSGIARHQGADGASRHAPLTLSDLDGAALGARAAAKARAQATPIDLEPGRYEVVLEPAAVADILASLALAGFNGKAINERQSFVRLGDQQFDPAISLVDDPLAVGFGFDHEGTPRRRHVLVDAGTTVALTHDRRTAAEAGATSTGHAFETRFAFGAIAQHLCLLSPDTDPHAGPASPPAGEVDGPVVDASVADLVAGVEQGLLVSDLWYTRMLDPRALVITGLTRNGVWRIEHGQITSPVSNLRFTQSYAQALMPGNVRDLGGTATPLPGDTYGATSPRWTCPALHLAAWNVTGGAAG
ncbi:TldD/PmbA family protein [soil metagenome]